ncbi:hypothetical protein C8R45DRAFT_938649 [Mycena sanguinolenta]|nr:hypothetical protein C8R45DRAFT_938649 [Mycena sanguinolenta]
MSGNSGLALFKTSSERHRRASDSSDTLLAGSSGKSSQAPKSSWLKSSRTLSLFSAALHLALVVIHLGPIATWKIGLEHHLIFPLEDQKFWSIIVSAIETSFGTTYSALLIFVTQTLSMRQSLRVNQSLTATHDNAAAWSL